MKIKEKKNWGFKKFKTRRTKKKAIKGKPDDKLSLQKEIYDRLLDERVDEIRKMIRETDYNKLIYHFKTQGVTPINFIKFKGLFSFFRDGDQTLEEIEEDQKKFKSSLGEIKSRNPKHKEGYQLDTTGSAKNLYDSR